jgi:outer membrane protein OmpA-like peptidoglycan-associated protein
MKASIKVLPFVLIAGMTHQLTQAETKQAEDSQSPKQAIAVMSSGIIGGLLAGPIGFFVAAVGADLLVDNESSIVKETLPDENTRRLLTIEPLVASSIDLAQALPKQPNNNTTTLNTENANDESTVEATEVTLAAINMDASAMTPTLLKDESELAINNDKIGITLLFGSSQYAVSDLMNEQLLALSKVLKKLPDDLIQIDGHTDPRGGSDFNLDLSQRRADSVASVLVAHGIDRARIVIRSFGETKSSSSEHDYDAHIAERYVDVSLRAVLTSSIVSQNGLPSEVYMPIAQHKQ